MNRSVMTRLVAKDLFLYRWIIIGTLIAGLSSLFVSGLDGAAGQIGEILLITSIVVLGVFLAIYGFLTERSSRSLLFVLSLPVSPMQYAVAKVAACLVAFLIPWLAITAVLVASMLAFDSSSAGQLPTAMVMMALFLANFCILIAIGMITGSEIWAVVGIIATNTSIPVLLGTVLPGLAGNTEGSVAVWSPTILVTLGVLVLVMVVSLGAAFVVQSRRRDFV